MASWDTGRMVSSAAGTDPTYRNLATTMNIRGMSPYGTTPYGQPSAYNPGGYSHINYNAGSGITMPAPTPASQAIAAFANLPPEAQATQTPAAQNVAGSGAPLIGSDYSQGYNSLGSTVSRRFGAQLAPQILGGPGAAHGAKQPTYEEYKQKMAEMQAYGREQGLTPEQLNAMASRADYLGVNNYGGGTAAGALSQWQNEDRANKEAMVATAAAPWTTHGGPSYVPQAPTLTPPPATTTSSAPPPATFQPPKPTRGIGLPTVPNLRR